MVANYVLTELVLLYLAEINGNFEMVFHVGVFIALLQSQMNHLESLKISVVRLADSSFMEINTGLGLVTEAWP